MSKQMFCHIMFWIFASGPIGFDIKYPYMYHSDRSCNIWIYSYSKVTSMVGIEIIPRAFPSVYRVMLSMLRKVVEAFVQLVSSVVNHPDHLLPF